jgi:coenzyme F420-reducing hydrogenase gamma subunit
VIAAEIVEEAQNRKKPLFIDRVMLVFFAMEKFGSKFFGKLLKADDNCNGCGLCAAKCPRANIAMDNGRPKFGWKCVICMKCLYSCPQNSIHARLPVLKKAVLHQGFDLRAIVKKAQKAHREDIAIEDKSYLFKGAVEYLKQDGV